MESMLSIRHANLISSSSNKPKSIGVDSFTRSPCELVAPARDGDVPTRGLDAPARASLAASCDSERPRDLPSSCVFGSACVLGLCDCVFSSNLSSWEGGGVEGDGEGGGYFPRLLAMEARWRTPGETWRTSYMYTKGLEYSSTI
ncbi:hypothetical protein RIF29_03660 [Crotalaria pallida]|uniref:Uncharacterized protein n=1 Tax=Crotalaria pallida TaxID=3830 RepID=A0AAN9J1H9_CROPI